MPKIAWQAIVLHYFLTDADMASSLVLLTSTHCNAISRGSRTVTGLLGLFSSVLSFLASSVLLPAFSSCNKRSSVSEKTKHLHYWKDANKL